MDVKDEGKMKKQLYISNAEKAAFENHNILIPDC